MMSGVIVELFGLPSRPNYKEAQLDGPGVILDVLNNQAPGLPYFFFSIHVQGIKSEQQTAEKFDKGMESSVPGVPVNAR
jgi:hypothetical protein